MFKKIALSSTLLLIAGFAVDTTVQVLETEGASVAQAADFTGRIKRVKIRKRRTGSGFKVVASSSNNSTSSSEAIAGATVALSTTDGKALETLKVSSASRGKVVGSTKVDTTSLTEKTVMTIKVTQGSAYFGKVQEFEISVGGLDAGTTEGANDYGWKARIVVDADTGETSAVLMNEDKDWAGDTLSSWTVSIDDGKTTTSVTTEEIRQRWISETTVDLSGYTSIAMETTLYDAKGNVVDTQSETVSLEESSATPELSKVTLKENKKGYAKMVTWTVSDGSAAALEMDLMDGETGKSVVMTVDDSPVRTQKAFVAENLEFDDGESPEGYTYLLLVDSLDENGDPVGEQYEVELTVPKAAEDGSNTTDYVTFADGQGRASFVNNGNGYHIHMAYEGDDWSEDGNFIFEEPFECPAPLETEVPSEMAMQFDKWVQVGSTSAPGTYEVTTSLTDEKGNELDTLTATGAGTGRVSNNGTGAQYGDLLSDGVPLEFD
jgi:hypothetical protein